MVVGWWWWGVSGGTCIAGDWCLYSNKASLREITVCSYSRKVLLNRLRGRIPHVHGNTSRDTLKQRKSLLQLVTASLVTVDIKVTSTVLRSLKRNKHCIVVLFLVWNRKHDSPADGPHHISNVGII